MPSKYEPLRQHLAQAPSDESVSMTFAAIDRLVGGLPPSSRLRQWWANPAGTTAAQYQGWLGAGRVVEAVDLDLELVRFSPHGVSPKARGSSSPVIADGVAALEAMVRQAGFPSTMHAVAAHTVFVHPLTVAQTGGAALFPVIRNMAKRRTFGELPADAEACRPSRRIYFDDNRTPTDCFLWATQRRKGPDVQYNHVWTCADNPDAYTALWNLCATPAFLAKTTDGNNHPEVVAALRRRSFDLYGHVPGSEGEPEAPLGYQDLAWAEQPAPVEDLAKLLRSRLRSAPKSPAALVARELGWLFSDWSPDESL